MLLFLLFSIFPMVIGFAVINVEYFRFAPVNVEQSSTTTVFVDPPMVIDDTLQADSYFTVNVNVSDVNDLFAWQVNMSWNPSILNVTTITFGDFLAGQPNGTSAFPRDYPLEYPPIKIDNDTCYAAFVETTLGDYPGVNGNGWLASIRFLVVGYGSTVLNINSTRTYLINNPLETIESTKTNGYFSNKLLGDIDGDRDVDPDDARIFSGNYGESI